MMVQSVLSLPRTKVNLDIALPYALLHLACLGVFWTGVTWTDACVCVASFYLRGFAVGAGYHRYFAHKSFKTSRAMQFLLALVGTLSVQRGVLWWAETHRHHHRCADTPADLHSPTLQGFIYSHSGWFMYGQHHQTNFSKVADLAKFPELVWLNNLRWQFLPISLYAFFIYLLFGWSGLIWGFAVSTVLLWHSVHWIQSMSHSYGGYRRCPSADNSRNHWLFGLISMGEFHNNHHYYPSSCRQGFAWWEIDINFYILKVLSWIGLVWNLKTPPEHVLRKPVQQKMTPAEERPRA